ncbi:hypothetical protein [uncultured Phascolarctobacterium sp.]|jgi:hypothetical protein|uniref:hypothetical protein n=1 Tax=uncultured Phascolarctobacterium sp. TaxID=512296 RepID=UPI0025E721DE|nr:hypothetical protein [uncultured Phascolarctobacterium sp.]
MLVLLIKKSPVIDNWEDVEKAFRRVFPNRSHLEGFCEGYCFDRHRLLTLNEFQERLNNGVRDITETHYVIFVEYGQEENEE